jgi:hypothetical protein
MDQPHEPLPDDLSLALAAALARVRRGIGRQRIAVADLARLQALLALVSMTGAASGRVPLPPAARIGLGVLATQLRLLAGRARDGQLDAAAVAALPPALRRRLTVRLERTSARLAGRGRPREHGDAAFQCARQHRACLKLAAADGRAFGELWCHLAMVVCLLRSLLPALNPQSATGAPARRA